MVLISLKYHKFSITFAIFGLIFFFLFGYMHESAHQEIFRSYGINSKIYIIKYFPDLVTIPETNCPTDSCNLANNINESVGYHLLPFFCMVYLGILFFLLYKESKDYDKYLGKTKTL